MQLKAVGKARKATGKSAMRSLLRWCSGLMLSLTICVDGLAAESGPTPSEDTSTPDGRLNTRCQPRGDDSRELCIVSFYRLIATPERYHGKLVAVTGYLRVAFGNIVLFPSELSFTGQAHGEGIAVFNYAVPETVASGSELEDGVSPVMVIAVFDATYVGSAPTLLGAFYDVRNMVKSPLSPPGG